MKNNTMYLVLDGANTKTTLDYLEQNNLPYVSGIALSDVNKYLYKPYQYDYVIITPSLDKWMDGNLHNLLVNCDVNL